MVQDRGPRKPTSVGHVQAASNPPAGLTRRGVPGEVVLSPQRPAYEWWHWHDDYGDAQSAELLDQIRRGFTQTGSSRSWRESQTVPFS